MKLLFIATSLFIITCCSTNDENSTNYEKVLNDLSNSHVLLYESMGREDYLEAFNLKESEYKIKLEEYNNAINSFYESDKGMIGYLLSFENDTRVFSYWIRRPNPYSAVRTKEDFISNSEAAMILIDNFLLNENKKHIIIKDRLSILSYKEFKDFYKIETSENLSQIKKNYKKLIESKSMIDRGTE